MPPGRRIPPTVRQGARRSLVTLTLVAGLWAPWHLAFAADDYAPIAQSLRAGRAAEALARTEPLLATRPRDPQLLFLRAQALAGVGRTADAIEAYLQLTQAYPELPEPYNNLAVLYASQNQLEAARASLEAALRTHPAYAVAHENLGDILLRLAMQSWSRARELDPALTTVPPKLAAARALADSTTARPRAPALPPASPPARAASSPR